MQVRLRVPPVLRRYSDGAEIVAVAGATAGAALEDLFRGHPDLRCRVLDKSGALYPYLLLFRNDEPATLATELADGDTLEIVGAAEGG